MGIESFDIKLTGCASPYLEVANFLDAYPGVTGDHTQLDHSDGDYFIYTDQSHLFEVMLRMLQEPVVYCRFAACNPATIDQPFYSFIRACCERFHFKVTILDDVAAGDKDVFDPPNYSGLQESLSRAAAIRRGVWRRACGSIEAAVTTTEALRRFLN